MPDEDASPSRVPSSPTRTLPWKVTPLRLKSGLNSLNESDARALRS